jgi:hypothetical protein
MYEQVFGWALYELADAQNQNSREKSLAEIILFDDDNQLSECNRLYRRIEVFFRGSVTVMDWIGSRIHKRCRIWRFGWRRPFTALSRSGIMLLRVQLASTDQHSVSLES